MTQEEKDLLLKDLCARLPYGVKLGFYASATKQTYICTLLGLEPQEDEPVIAKTENGSFYMLAGHVKPYLFPLSNMTEEQYKEWGDLAGEPLDEILTRNAKGEIMSTLEHHLLIAKSLTDSVNYCYKNHFDIYGLIPMGLAIDATGLNIY